MISKLICFVACHGPGPADHFATFSEKFQENGYQVKFYASGAAYKKLQERGIQNLTFFDAENLSTQDEVKVANQIAQNCFNSTVTITDIGTFNESLLKALKERSVRTITYYDNPEPYVPGGYSAEVKKVAGYASKILFANSHLAETPLYQEEGKVWDFPFDRRIGLGYYPLEQVDQIISKRNESHKDFRSSFLLEQGILDKGQKILTYFGGNNTEYFEKAFPALLTYLSECIVYKDLSNLVIVFQQHPGAKSKNYDKAELEHWIAAHKYLKNVPKIIFSDKTSSEMQIITEGAMYFQTSLGPIFALAGIPRAQVGHEVFEDVLVRGGLCCIVNDAFNLVEFFSHIKEKAVSMEERDFILKSLGIRENWINNLLSVCN